MLNIVCRQQRQTKARLIKSTINFCLFRRGLKAICWAVGPGPGKERHDLISHQIKRVLFDEFVAVSIWNLMTIVLFIRQSHTIHRTPREQRATCVRNSTRNFFVCHPRNREGDGEKLISIQYRMDIGEVYRMNNASWLRDLISHCYHIFYLFASFSASSSVGCIIYGYHSQNDFILCICKEPIPSGYKKFLN